MYNDREVYGKDTLGEKSVWSYGNRALSIAQGKRTILIREKDGIKKRCGVHESFYVLEIIKIHFLLKNCIKEVSNAFFFYFGLWLFLAELNLWMNAKKWFKMLDLWHFKM